MIAESHEFYLKKLITRNSAEKKSCSTKVYLLKIFNSKSFLISDSIFEY